MSPLSTDLRNQLAKAIKDARRGGEAGARKALAALAVDRHEPHGSMAPAERRLRNRLRAHGRQLGDRRDPKTGTQEVDRLAHEVAYEHWHRMLFARFLAENHLLIEPESGVAVSMAECEELAREQGDDPWALAGRFAQGMLPRIFRPDDPALEVTLAPENRQALERLLASLPPAVFTAADALGWTYQFWQAERKDGVNKSGVKIGADELPAVTQLFTEHYMVQFLFHNTVGAWRAGTILAERPDLAERAESEEELRRAVRVEAQGGYDFAYLRFVRESRDGDEEGKPTGRWRPAAGAFEGWPREAAALRVLDPCCGSGHFLVEGFELLVRLRIEEESLGLEEAIRGVLQDNLFGLEIDPRCTQIAAFNLAFAAWRLAGQPLELPTLQVACSGLSVGTTKGEWLGLARDESLRDAMERLYDLFERAPELGSLIDPGALETDLFQADFSSVQPLLAAALERELASEEQMECAVAAQGMARAAELLLGRNTLVITNVPYLARGKQRPSLKKWVAAHFPDSRADLATTFLDRFQLAGDRGETTAFVTPQNWLFLPSYQRFRRRLLVERRWDLVARLGSNAFRGMNFWAATTALTIISQARVTDRGNLTIFDVSEDRSQQAKAKMLAGYRPCPFAVVRQCLQIENPDSRIGLTPSTGHELLSRYATSPQGIKTGDDPMFRRCMWEIATNSQRWRPFQGSSSESKWINGLHTVVDFVDEGARFARLQGRPGWGRQGVVLKLMGKAQTSLHTGALFDSNVTIVVPRQANLLPAIALFCASKEYAEALREAEQGAKINNATAVKVPFDAKFWRARAEERWSEGLPKLVTADPTQWLFHGHPAKAEPQTVLQVAIARLLGYRWPPERDPGIGLDAEARGFVEGCSDLDAFADTDGIACLPALRGEATAAGRLRRLLAAAYRSDWSGAKERELLAAAAGDGKPASTLDEWLRDRFFEEHCKLFHQRPFVWHFWDASRDGFHALVNYHRLAGPDGEGRRTLEALTYGYLGDWIARQKAEQRKSKEGADARLASALDLQAQLERILAGEPPCDLFVRWKPLHEQAIGWEPDINDGIRLNIRPFLSAELRTGGRKGAGLLRWKPNVKWGKDRGKEPASLRPKADFPWFWGCPGGGTSADRTDFMGGPEFDGNRWNDLHYTNHRKGVARRQRTGERRGAP